VFVFALERQITARRTASLMVRVTTKISAPLSKIPLEHRRCTLVGILPWAMSVDIEKWLCPLFRVAKGNTASNLYRVKQTDKHATRSRSRNFWEVTILLIHEHTAGSLSFRELFGPPRGISPRGLYPHVTYRAQQSWQAFNLRITREVCSRTLCGHRALGRFCACTAT
jgi:hypothetical protein